MDLQVIKQYIIVRKDLNMPYGKFGAQIGHAVNNSIKKCDNNIIKKWEETGETKIVLSVKSEEKLINIFNKLKEKKIPCFLVKDEGRTVFNEQTYTCLGVGPIDEKYGFKILKRLQLY